MRPWHQVDHWHSPLSESNTPGFLSLPWGTRRWGEGHPVQPYAMIMKQTARLEDHSSSATRRFALFKGDLRMREIAREQGVIDDRCNADVG